MANNNGEAFGKHIKYKNDNTIDVAHVPQVHNRSRMSFYSRSEPVVYMIINNLIKYWRKYILILFEWT